MSLRELQLAMRPLPFLDASARSPGGVLELRTRLTRRLLVWHPDVIEEIFRLDQRLCHPGSRSLIPLLGRQSLLWADGARHAAYRRVLGPPLRGRRLLDYHRIIAGTVDEAVDELIPGTVITLSRWTRQLALRIVARIILGRSDAELLAAFTAWIDDALGSRPRSLAYRWLRGGLPRSGDELDRSLVRCAKDNPSAQPSTLAGLMLAADGPLGRLDDAELRDQLVSLLFAGHETTASAIAWTLYWLDRHENLRHDVLAELVAAGDGSDAAQVPLLQAVLQEVLRLTPPVPVGANRALAEDAVLGGRPLAAGTVLTPSSYLAHRRPEVFRHPHRFDPSRFLGDRVAAQHFFPFGGGSRRCLGNQLAQLEVRMVTAAVLRRREWSCVNPGAGIPELRGHTMAPAARLRMRVLRCRE
ncbi:MAG: cytochrome P450 [Pseudonocardiaceae bacterium]